MANNASSRPKTANAPGSSATSREGPNVLRKKPSMRKSPALSVISRRHSWTSPPVFMPSNHSAPMPRDMCMEDASAPLTSHGVPDTGDSLLSNRRAFSTTRVGATFDMAYFLRHTGPPTTAQTVAAHEAAKDQPKRASRKKSRGIIFKKRSESPEAEAPAVVEEQKPTVFVPPEGVEQKITARGNKYLQIVPHPDLIDLGRAYHRHQLSSPTTEFTEAVSSEALDTWISELGIQNHNGGDFAVKPPEYNDMQAHERAESQSGSCPRSPLSFVSEARSMLPKSHDGFGLSIVDGSNMAPYLNGSFERSDALRGNPPSSVGTPPQMMHARQQSLDKADLPLLDDMPAAISMNEPLEQGPGYVHEIKSEVSERIDRRPKDVLAGQGLRRPGRDEVVLVHPETSSPDIYPAAAVQSRRKREAIVRARKIKALQQARKTMDQISREKVQRKRYSHIANQHVDIFDDRVQSSMREGNIQTHMNQMTETMVVAEQAPLPRGRVPHKPARLVLREHSVDPSISVTGQDEDCATARVVAPDTRILQKPRTPPQQALPNQPTKSSSHNTPTQSFFTPCSNAKHHSTPLMSMSVLAPLAVTPNATQPGGIRASLCSSSHTSQSKEAWLEARLEAVERENRLLEAALMAVLKTSGTLNRCPCTMFKEHPDAAAKVTDHFNGLKPSPLSPSALSRLNTTVPPIAGRLDKNELKRVSKEAARTATKPSNSSTSSECTRPGSWDSNNTGISALEIYLRTKIGA